jgi:hypothetical protein
MALAGFEPANLGTRGQHVGALRGVRSAENGKRLRSDVKDVQEMHLMREVGTGIRF